MTFRSLREQGRHSVHATSPGRLELIEDRPCPADRIALGVHEVLAPTALLGHQAGSLEHRDVLLDRRKAHGVEVSESRHRGLVDDAATKDVPPGGVSERVEEPVDLLAGGLSYNHSVVG